ncbi:MAG: hypothetical protein FD141_1615 [Fusobacteria bacterium]|nr:MAG: hypothetical protein FD141_1615 [Fusobacteriota bacterium]KAF0228069.1 MAG: hypothetical protein FD182_1617 [Fusobacteriota bacterium]
MVINSIKGKKVLKIEENQRFNHVVEGVYRFLANPIKKNIKHIEISVIIKDVLRDKLQRGKMLQNSEIARHIREFQEKNEKEMIKCPNKM